MIRARLPCLGLVGVLLVGSASAQQAPTDVDRARELARESADLLDRKQYADALDRATRAEALHHAAFHVAVIAESLEGLGRLAEAAAKYEALVAEPLPPSAPRVFQEAQQKGKLRLSQLLAKVPSLLVIVRGEATGASVTVDGAPLPLGSGTAVRFDPGPHEIQVTAAGFRPFARTVTLPPRGGVVMVEVVLDREGAQGAQAAPSAAPAATALAATAAPSVPPSSTAAPSGGSRLPAAIAFGAGGAGLVLGAISGALFLDRLGGLRERCPESRCAPGDEPEIDAVRTLGTVSTAGFAVAGVGAALGAVLLLVRPGGTTARQGAPSGLSIGPWLGAGSVGLTGRF